ncbi:MAG: DHH family phosphoesterase [Bacillaceae bacterium]|nr:DHH family phosphoesterase [Bacillaceae bacterium]
MPKFLLKRWHGLHMILALFTCVILAVILTTFNWGYGVIGFALTGVVAYYTFKAEQKFRRDLQRYVATLSHRVKKVGDEVLQELPIGIILYNEDRIIEWSNPFMNRMTEKDSVIGSSLYDVIPQLAELDDEANEADIVFDERIYHVLHRPEERLLYFTDVTELKELKLLYNQEKVVFAIVHLDNLDEVAQGMDEQNRTLMLTEVTGALTNWAQEHQMYMKRYASDKFFVVMDQATLDELEQTRFDILDVVREMTADNKIPVTLSIGVGAGENSLIELGELAQSSLDIALGRGGDQAAVKTGGKIRFYGGKSNAVEKRTRVRARVISHALRDLIQESENVLIMGHKGADMDAIGAAIGVLRAVRSNDKEGYIVLDETNASIERLMNEIEKHETLPSFFITPEEAVQLVSEHSLVVMVDTHRPSMTIEPKLLNTTSRIVVVDHHRRAEEFVQDPVLIYLEPYASSTCELVTELLQYHKENLEMDPLEATALLAGIMVDTRSFAYRTGSRTFEAASFLRRNGADISQVQQLLKENLEDYKKKIGIVQNAEVLYDQIAIAKGDPDVTYDQVQIAQAADTLLTMSGIKASFVICRRPDDLVSISARSFGEVNVQTIMEQLGGGGHLTNAATQLGDISIDEAVERLKHVLDEIQNEGGFSS